MPTLLNPSMPDVPGNRPMIAIGNARMNKLHAAALAMNAAHTATPTIDPSAADVSPAVTDPIPMLSETAAETPAIVAPAAAVIAAVVAAKPARLGIGAALAFGYVNDRVSDAFRFRGHVLNGSPAPSRRDSIYIGENGASLALATSPVVLNADDVPALLNTARALLRGNNAIDADASFAAALYLSNRATKTSSTYFADLRANIDRARIGALDVLMYRTRAAERIVYAIRRLSPVDVRGNFAAGYSACGMPNVTDAVNLRRLDMINAINAAFPETLETP